MKLVRMGFVTVLLLLLVVPVGWAKGGKPAKEPQADCAATVVFQGMTTNEDGTSTWSYEVSEPGGKCKDLSNWAVALPKDAVVVSAEPTPYEVGVNPHTGLYSIKWDVTDSFKSGVFTFTLDGSYTPGDVPCATKAGPTVVEGTVTGPFAPGKPDDEPPPSVG
jgi:hypothetical protein